VGNIRRGGYAKRGMHITRQTRQKLDHAYGSHGASGRCSTVAAGRHSMIAIATTAAVLDVHLHFGLHSVLAIIGSGGLSHGHGRHRAHGTADRMHAAVHGQRLSVNRKSHQQQPRETRQNPKEWRAFDMAK
jgi:hypothetical protein